MKQIVEEAVTRKFIHADSTSITSLCGELFSWVLQKIVVDNIFLWLYQISKQVISSTRYFGHAENITPKHLFVWRTIIKPQDLNFVRIL